MRSWAEMLAWQIGLLERAGGAGLAEWNERIRSLAPADEPALRAWLTAHGVAGYAAMLLVLATPTSSPRTRRS